MDEPEAPRIHPTSPCPQGHWERLAGTYSRARGSCSACLTIFARKTLEGREKGDMMTNTLLQFHSPPRTGQMHFLTHSFQTSMISQLNSFAPLSVLPSLAPTFSLLSPHGRLPHFPSLLTYSSHEPKKSSPAWAQPHRIPRSHLQDHLHTQQVSSQHKATGGRVGYLLLVPEHQAAPSRQLCQALPGKRRKRDHEVVGCRESGREGLVALAGKNEAWGHILMDNRG